MSEGKSSSSSLDIRTLSVLVTMLYDGDEADRKVASRALDHAPHEEVARLLSDPDLPSEVMDFFVERCRSKGGWMNALLKNPSLPGALRDLLEGHPAGGSGSVEGETTTSSKELSNEGVTEGEEGELPLTQKIQMMTVSDKIKAALTGGKEVRTLLLENPGIKESEIEMLTKNTSTNVDILRAIAKNREWSANKTIVKNLVLNSKTPVQIALRFLPRMTMKELEYIDKSKNLPSALRLNARKLLLQKQKGR
jgi:hypothetical protein